MKPLAYLGFTIFSVIMQFCVMEFINETLHYDKDSANFNGSHDVIKDIKRKPHALFYRTETDKISFEAYKGAVSKKYSNTSLDDVLTTTDISSTTYEVYYENTSVIDEFFTTESYSTISEFDNVTEITFVDKHNVTTVRPSVNKRVTSKSCLCNLLYEKCDINCCCDTDCTEEERSLFINCVGDDCSRTKKNGIEFCNSYPTCRSIMSTDLINDFFCVVKVNLPEKRIKSNFEMNIAALNVTYKWNSIKKSDYSLHYKKSKYKYGDPLWLIKNGIISPLDLPTTTTNYYCNGKKQIYFLENDNIKCNVKVKDLHMFSALKTLEETKLISITDLSVNATVLNCSSLHCTNWSVLACTGNICVEYNKTLHTPACYDNYCNNLAHMMEYTFYYFDSKITNASLKLYLTRIHISIPLVMQKITVQWYLGDKAIDDAITLSGNPGYIPGLPLIISPATNNRTKNFYNQTYGKSVLSFPTNVNGQCNWLNKNKTLLFGINTRLKCRMNIKQNVSLKNASHTCQTIQTNIKSSLRLNQILFISPYGNPRNVSDDNWIPLEVYDRTFIYGEYRLKNSKLICYNLVTRYAFVIAYADTSEVVGREKNKIVKATVDVTYFNVTFNLPALSTVLTIDVRFIDISKPIIEFAGAPHFNFHFPANFFLDYHSSDCHYCTGEIVLILHCCTILLMMK